MTYTVNLPLDLKLGENSSEEDIPHQSEGVMDCTRELDPWAYVLHLNGRSVKDSKDDNVF